MAGVPAGRSWVRRAAADRAGSAGWTGRCTTTGCCCSTSAGPAGPPRPTGARWPGLGSPRAQADYLALFRADAIVADAELVRQQVTGGRPWSVLGQSFGGFCTVTYLSHAPEGLSEAFITGGLPGLDATADDVYRRPTSWWRPRTPSTTRATRGDVERAKEIARSLAAGDVRLPGGAPLTVEAFQSLGRMLGASTGSHTLHYLLEDPFAGRRAVRRLPVPGGGAPDVLGRARCTRCCTRPATRSARATRWAAQRVRAEFPEFDAAAALDGDAPLLFTGEMIYPWMFENDPVLAPLAEAAEILARRDSLAAPLRRGRGCGPARCRPPPPSTTTTCTCRASSRCGRHGAIRGLRPWITNEYEHDGLRVSNGRVLDRLIAMVRGNA